MGQLEPEEERLIRASRMMGRRIAFAGLAILLCMVAMMVTLPSLYHDLNFALSDSSNLPGVGKMVVYMLTLIGAVSFLVYAIRILWEINDP